MLTVRKGKGDAAEYYREEQTRAAYYGRTGEVRASPEIAQHLGIEPGREMTAAELSRLMEGRRADGGAIAGKKYRPDGVHWADFTFSASKSVSVAVALAETQEERAKLIGAFQEAARDAMAYVEQRVGYTRLGGQSVKAELSSVAFDHFASRPTEVHGELVSDPNLHRHHIVSATVLAADGSGRLGALDLQQLAGGVVKEGGAVFQASLSRRLRELGAEVRMGAHGEAELAAIPRSVVNEFSRRRDEVRKGAQAYAEAKGMTWDALSERQKLRRERATAAAARRAKIAPADKLEKPHEETKWRGRAALRGYEHSTVFRGRDRSQDRHLSRHEGAYLEAQELIAEQRPVIKPSLTPEQRHEAAYQRAEKLIGEAFTRDAVLPIGRMRELIARGYVETGGMVDPGRDIDAVVEHVRGRGIWQGAHRTHVEFVGEHVTTQLHVSEERQAIDLAATLHQEGRLSAEIGGAGSGKSTRIAEMADRWRAEGREVWGAALAWRQTGDFAAAGIDKDHRAALLPALRRIERGKWDVRRGDVLVVDELGLVGTRMLGHVLQAADRHGLRLHLAGDDRQCRSPEAGPPLELLRKAGVPLPEHVTNYRQQTEREQVTASLWREGRSAEALARMADDGRVTLAPDREATVGAAAALWKPDGPLLIVPTNSEGRELGAAVRALRAWSRAPAWRRRTYLQAAEFGKHPDKMESQTDAE